MDKDQCHVQTLRTLYLHGILLPQGLFIAEKNTLKRASWLSLKQMITSSGSWDISDLVCGSWDISDLVCGDLVIADWSADDLVNTDCFEIFLV